MDTSEKIVFVRKLTVIYMTKNNNWKCSIANFTEKTPANEKPKKENHNDGWPLAVLETLKDFTS